MLARPTFAVVFASCLVLDSSALYSQEYAKDDRIVVWQETTLRIESTTIETVPRGTQFNVRSVQGRWLWVQGPRSGKFGWIDSRHVTPVAPPPPSGAPGTGTARPFQGGPPGRAARAGADRLPSADSSGNTTLTIGGRSITLPGLSDVAELPELPPRNAYRNIQSRIPVIVSLAPLGRQLLDVKHVLTTAGFAPLWSMLEPAIANGWTDGIDLNRPAGGFFTPSSGKTGPPAFVFFIGVNDMSQFLRTLQGPLVNGKVLPLGERVWELELPHIAPQKLVLHQADEWLFVSNQAQALKQLPARPDLLLGDLPAKYNVAVQLQIGDLAAPLREQLLAVVRNIPRGAPSSATTSQQSLPPIDIRQHLVELVEQCRNLTLGLTIDRHKGRTELQLSYEPQPGTQMARNLAGISPADSRGAALLKSNGTAAVVINAAWTPDNDGPARLLRSIRGSSNPQQRDAMSRSLKPFIGLYFEEVLHTLEQGILDVGINVDSAPDSFQIMISTYLADYRRTESAVRSLIEGESAAGNVFNPEIRPGSAPIHSVRLPPSTNSFLRKSLGDSPRLAVQAEAGRLTLSIGRNPDAALERLGSVSSSEGAPLQILSAYVDLSDLVKFGMATHAFQSNPLLTQVLSSLPPAEDFQTVTVNFACSHKEGAVLSVGLSDYTLRLIGIAMMAKMPPPIPRK